MSDELFMKRCLTLAKQGIGHVAPNPLVGAVVVHEGKIIGEGYHQEYGSHHAEVNAINSVADKSLLASSTIYVNLEPCAHHGKTPPCADLIITSNIPKIVIGCVDTYAEVAGKGIERLQRAGREVVTGVMQKESEHLNRRFFTFHNKKRPYIILKWAQSQDGFIDAQRASGEKGVNWITQKATKQLVHKWRHEEAGILVGANTIIIDNPSLTVREVEGKSPTRFVIDPTNKIAIEDYVIGQDGGTTHLLQSEILEENLAQIHDLGIQSIIVEGGAYTLQQFIDHQLWDEARILTGSGNLNSGLAAPKLASTPSESFQFGIDFVQIHFND